MIDITPSRECGNSPKNQFAEQIALALESRDVDILRNALDEHVIWERSDGSISGRDQVVAQLENMQRPDGLRVDHVVTHGKAGAVNGVTEFKGTERDRRFCHVLTFTNTKCQTVQRITSFSR